MAQYSLCHIMVPHKYVQNYNVMGICKAALESSVRYIAVDLGKKNTRINCISAGAIKTLASYGISGFQKLFSHTKNISPLNRNVECEDIAKSALYLLSDMSSALTGQTIYVDCGTSIIGFNLNSDNNN